MNFLKTFLTILLGLFALNASILAQDRARIVTKEIPSDAPKSEIQSNVAESQKPLINKTASSRPIKVLTTEITLVRKEPVKQSSGASNSDGQKILVSPKKESAFGSISATQQAMLLRSMSQKAGARYVFGSAGPYTFDCSGFIWKVFQESGFNFDRTSARNYWNSFTPVYGEERFRLGTLVFFNSLGHIGIVVDEQGFYHASTSKGVMYSKFDSYWSKRIVGFRRVNVGYSE